MKEISERMGNAPLPQEMKDLSDDDLYVTFVRLGEASRDRVFGAALLDAYAKEVRRRGTIIE